MDPPTHFVLRTGARIPSVGFGTSAADTPSIVRNALDAGYRHLDCAWKYGVDKQVGQAIQESGVPRNEIFITTKFWPNFARQPELCLDICLEAMQLDYVDLFLMHWPVAFVPDGDLRRAVARNPLPEEAGFKWHESGKPVIDVEYSENLVHVWRKMEDVQRKGKAKALGVSNFSAAQLERLLPHVSPDTPLCVNQVEVHPWFPNAELVEYCKGKGVIVQAYSPMGGRTSEGKRRVDDAGVMEIALRRDLAPGQVLQSWAVQRDTIPLGRSSDPKRMRSNLLVKRLTDEEMSSLKDLDLGGDKGRKGRADWDWPFFQ